MMLTNLVYIFHGDQVLLAMKKRSHGVGKWNGPGGKVKVGESMKDAACREVWEEVGLRVLPDDLIDVGVVEFVYEGQSENTNRCSVFLARVFSGELTESDEMRPQWFPLADLPWDNMWKSDEVWLLQALRGERVQYRILSDANLVTLGTEIIT